MGESLLGKMKEKFSVKMYYFTMNVFFFLKRQALSFPCYMFLAAITLLLKTYQVSSLTQKGAKSAKRLRGPDAVGCPTVPRSLVSF